MDSGHFRRTGRLRKAGWLVILSAVALGAAAGAYAVEVGNFDALSEAVKAPQSDGIVLGNDITILNPSAVLEPDTNTLNLNGFSLIGGTTSTEPPEIANIRFEFTAAETLTILNSGETGNITTPNFFSLTGVEGSRLEMQRVNIVATTGTSLSGHSTLALDGSILSTGYIERMPTDTADATLELSNGSVVQVAGGFTLGGNVAVTFGADSTTGSSLISGGTLTIGQDTTIDGTGKGFSYLEGATVSVLDGANVSISGRDTEGNSYALVSKGRALVQGGTIAISNGGALRVGETLTMETFTETSPTSLTLESGGQLSVANNLVVTSEFGDSATITLTGASTAYVGTLANAEDDTEYVEGNVTLADTTLSLDGGSALVVSNAMSVAGGSLDILNASTLYAGAFSTNVANAEETLDIRISGTDESQANHAALSVASLTFNGLGTTNFILQNGGTLYVGGDLTLAADTPATFSTDEGATTGGALSVGGTLTLNRNLTVSKDTANVAPISTLNAGTLALENTEFDVTGGAAVQVGAITGAGTAGTSATINVSGGSSLGALKNEPDTTWTGAMSLGAADGGSVNINISENSSLTVANNATIHLQNGDAVNITGGTDDSDAPAFVAYGDANITANDGTAAVNLTNNAQLGTGGDLTLGANSGGTLNVTVDGVDEDFMAKAASDNGLITGGAGTTNIAITDNGSVTGADVTLAADVSDAGAGTHVTLSGENSVLAAYEMTSTDETTGNTTTRGGTLTIGGRGNATVTAKDKAVIYAKKNLVTAAEAGSNGDVNLESGAFLQSEGDMTLGQGGASTVTAGEGSQILATGLLTVGDAGTANVTTNGAVVQSAGVVIGKTGAGSSLDMTGGAWYILADTIDTPEITGDGTLDVKNMTSTDGTSLVYFNAGGGVYLNGNATFDNSLVVFGTDTEDASKKGLLSVGDGTASFTNGSILAGMPNFTGDFSIDGTSTYEVQLNLDGTSEKITITDGKATIGAGANLKAYFTQNGQFQTMKWTVMEIDSADATDVITGTWNIESPIPFYEFEQNLRDEGQTLEIEAKLDDEYFQKRVAAAGGNADEAQVAKFMDTYNAAWFDTLSGLAYGEDEALMKATAQLNGSARANSMMLARQSLWVPVAERISWSENCTAYTGPRCPFCPAGKRSSLWFQSGWRGTSVEGGERSKGYDTNAFSLLLGVDTVFESYLAGGVFFGYSSPEMEMEYATADAQNFSFGAYLGYKMMWGMELKALLAYTYSDYDLHRDLSALNTSASTSFNGDGLTMSVELARPIFLNPLVIRPTFAIDSECIWQGEAVEEGAGIYGLYYARSAETWTFARFGASADFAFSDTLTLKGKAFYALQIDGDSVPNAKAAYVSTRDMLIFTGDDPGDGYFNLGMTLSYTFGAKRQVMIYGNYDGYFSDEMDAHLATGGLQWAF